jgi:Fur family transcriptional regulator, ferric uptake regulator
MTDTGDILKSILKQHSQSVTKQRLLVFNLLVGQEPITMNELIGKAAGRVDKVSVYRTITLFEQVGITQRINIGWKYKIELTDKFSEHHHHLICLKCGDVIAIGDEKHIDDFIDEVADKFGFEPRKHQFEVDGYCKKCRTIRDHV